MNQTGRDYLKRIQVNCERMMMVTSRLLQLSRLDAQPLKYCRVDLGRLADNNIIGLRTIYTSRSVSFLRKGDMVIEGDRELLTLLMQNLLDNAWKFTASRETAEILFTSCEMGGERVFKVIDNGVGFSPAQSDKLFQLFQRFHDSDEYDGEGIGLITAQRVVQRHGGRIWIESSEGLGTIIYFTLAQKV